jgi:rubredoxin
MKQKTKKHYCKICGYKLMHVIIYDCSWYKCNNCGAVFEVEEYWEEENKEGEKE